MQSLLEKVSDLNAMILQGKALEAFEKYYHDDVTMQENNFPAVVGKEENRKREEEFFGAITEFRGAEPLKITAHENVTMVEWHFDYVHKDWGDRKFNQVAVQEWEDGKIIHERFYYPN